MSRFGRAKIIILSLLISLCLSVLPAHAVSGTNNGYGPGVPTPPRGAGGSDPIDFLCQDGWVVTSVSVEETPFFIYSTIFEFTCSPLSESLKIDYSQSETITPLRSTAEPSLRSSCTSGLVAYGFRGNVSDSGTGNNDGYFLNDIGLNCFDPFTAGNKSELPLVNSLRDEVVTSDCPNDEIVGGFALRKGAGTDRVYPICFDFSDTRENIIAQAKWLEKVERERKLALEQMAREQQERIRKEREQQEILLSILALGAAASAVSNLMEITSKKIHCRKDFRFKAFLARKCPKGWAKAK